jgi:ribosomal protein L7/L12
MTNQDSMLSLMNVYEETTDVQMRDYLIAAMKRLLTVMHEKSDPDSCLTAEEVHLLHAKGKLAAIKALRTRTECGLIAAKDLIEDWMKERGLEFVGR